MKRTLIFLLCLTFTGASAAPVETYLAARDRYIARFNAPGAADSDQTPALTDLERQLRAFIAPWQAPGFPATGKINLEGLTQDLGYGRLDGLSYQSKGGDTTVVVTTLPLLKHWIAEHKNWWEKETNVPQTVEAALASEPFYTQATGADAAAVFYAAVPVAAPHGASVAVAELAAFTQDMAPDRPSDILVAVVAGERVFVAQRTLTGKINAAPVCHSEKAATRAQADAALRAYQSSHLQDRKSFDAHVALEAKADRDYRRCFSAHLMEQPGARDAIRQAQALTDLLH